MTLWYGNLSVVNRVKLSKIVNEASKIIGMMHRHLSDLYCCKVKQKALMIFGDVSHPFYGEF